MKKRVREIGEKGVGSVSANPHGSSLGEVLVKANSDETIMSVGLFQSSFYEVARQETFIKCLTI
jgi:hypothetical protein